MEKQKVIWKCIHLGGIGGKCISQRTKKWSADKHCQIIYIYVKTVNNFFPQDKFRVIKIHFLKITYNKNEILRAPSALLSLLGLILPSTKFAVIQIQVSTET